AVQSVQRGRAVVNGARFVTFDFEPQAEHFCGIDVVVDYEHTAPRPFVRARYRGCLLLCGSLGKGQAHDELAAVSRAVAVGRDRAAMEPHDPACEREPDSEARDTLAVLGHTREHSEDDAELIGWNANSGVA